VELQPTRAIVLGAVWLTNLITLGVPLKIWNNTRLEMALKEQEGLAIRAPRGADAADQRTFFNTSADPWRHASIEMARDLIQKLSAILRRVLDKQRTVPLRRAGLHRRSRHRGGALRVELRIVKGVEGPARLALVPCMVLQPVENAVLHRPAAGRRHGHDPRARRRRTRAHRDRGRWRRLRRQPLDLGRSREPRPGRGIGRTSTSGSRPAYGQG
jgi:hypothetical protein